MINWIKASGQDGHGRVGKFMAFSYHWSIFKNKNDPKKICLTCKLNGMKEDQGSYETTDQAIEKAEKVFQYWLEHSGLEVKQ